MVKNKQKKTVAIVAGGDSGERSISLGSASVIRQNIDRTKFDAHVILISKEKWVCVKNGKEIAVDKNDFSIKNGNNKARFDVVFMAIHGTPGEDGRLQGYFDLLGIPYTCCGQLAAALTFNKAYCNKVVAHLGVRTAKSLHFFKGHIPGVPEISREIKLPVFVKPANGGSSVGMSKVKKKDELLPAIRRALRENDEILIEEFVKGPEITCGVLKYKGKMIVLPITKIVSLTEYFDYAAKYKGKSKEITPAPLSEAAEVLCKRTSAMLYEKMNCRGVVRFDYILSRKGLYFLEVNTVPGLSAESIIPQQAQVFGYSLPEFFTMLVEDALWRQKKGIS